MLLSNFLANIQISQVIKHFKLHKVYPKLHKGQPGYIKDRSGYIKDRPGYIKDSQVT
jgi:hypothetical protein